MLHEMGYAEALRRIAECKDGRHEKLDLGGLGLKSVPEELFELNWLRKLNLGKSLLVRKKRSDMFGDRWAYNSISELPTKFSEALPHLASLDVSSIGLHSLEPLAGLKNLERLDCSSASVRSLEPLSDLRFLKRLNCASTNITSLLSLRGLRCLRRLNIRYCRGVTNLEGLENLPNLKRLVCSNTKVSNLEPLRGLPRLARLECSDTWLDNLEPLSGLVNLARVRCIRANLASLKGLENLPRLARLDCSSNRIESLEPLRNSPSLTRLDCSRNPLTRLTGLENLHRLRKVSCANTQIRDLKPLEGLASLESLNCSSTNVGSLEPLKGLPNLSILACHEAPVTRLTGLENLPRLKVLGCSKTLISGLVPLRGLPQLTKLSCGGTSVSDLGPLRGLPCLSELECPKTGVMSLEPLRGLPRLKKLDCASSNVRSLDPLKDVPLLTDLNCANTSIDTLEPLTGHPCLEKLNCDSTNVRSLTPLKGLSCLSWLDCGHSKITTLDGLEDLPGLSRLDFGSCGVESLAPLRNLPGLVSLTCSRTRITSLEGIQGLSRLSALDCSHTPLTSLAGVEKLKGLIWLECSKTKIASFDPLLALDQLASVEADSCGTVVTSPELWLKPSLVHVELFGTKLHGVPDEVLSEQNCIYELAAHCADLGDNPERLSDVKLMVLGNGRVGKTQLVRRLQGRAYQDNSDSTHGIMVESTPLPIGHDGETVPVKIWDFGGQDIYHATHALFYRTRAIFLICWHPDFENEKTVDLDGFRSRNHELPYWLKHVQHCADSSGAVLVAQTRCDREGDGEQEPYGTLNALKGLGGYVRHDLKTSAATGLGLDALVADLKEAYAGINPPLIGPGRAQVKRLLEERLARIEQAKAVNGGDLPEVEKALRTLTVEEFKSLCEDAGQISDPDLFLKFLHDAGVVFWQEGLLHDRIVLDQNWALEAIYALFNRDHCVARLREAEGRFTAADVGTWLWDRDFSFGDQQLFLAMMKSCGICFHVHDGVYIAPEFLPEEPPHEVRQNWPGSNDFGTVVQIFEKQERVKVFHSHLSTRTLIRSIICVHGPFYGIKGAYWATGIQFVDEEFGCIGMIEYTKAVSSVFRDQDEGDSTITIRVRPVRKSVDGSLELFFERLCNGVRAEADQLGIEIW